MISSLTTSLVRISVFWYVLGMLVLFVGDPAWAEAAYARLMLFPWVPEIQLGGLFTAASVQWHLLVCWSFPLALVWGVSITVSYVITLGYSLIHARLRERRLQPRGEFWGVTIPNSAKFKSLGALPAATTPKLEGVPVALPGGPPNAKAAQVELQGVLLEAVKLLTAPERQLCEELLQLLYAAPDHFAGHGHGVGLLEHTLNVVTEAAGKCNADFRLPLLAALAHDVGKLVTFIPDGKGGWKRKGLHSRESARILATLPGFQQLPDLHRNALLLAVKYDHAPNKMPQLRGERDSSMLAMRVITALSHADRAATAGEKDRNLVKLQPEDLLWLDFVNFLREAPIVQRGKKGAANQVNNPPDSPYLYIYEAPWRDAAIPRMPAEVAAALDLTRRDAGKMAKYTRILAERLRKEGLLVEEHDGKKVSDTNPLWDIQSGTGEKAVVLRGILVLKADALWKALNYRLSTKSPFPVQILSTNASLDGTVNEAPKANRDIPKTPDVSDGLKLGNVDSPDAMASLGLVETAPPASLEGAAPAPGAPAAAGTPSVAPKPKTRGRFKGGTPSPVDDGLMGLAPAARQLAEPVPSASPAAEPKDHHTATDITPEPLAIVEPAEGESDSMSVALARALDALKVTNHADEAPELEVVTPLMYEEPLPDVLVDNAALAPEIAVPSVTAPAPAPADPTKPDLSRAEKREGLSIADAAACAKYPGLELGEKFYTEQSSAVQAGLKKPGSRYKGDDKSKQLDLGSAGPRRAKRKTS